jgi:hypothetical protein
MACLCALCPSCETRIQIEYTQDRARQMETEKDSTREQRLVQMMVFNEITAYPDEAWSSLLGGLINRLAIVFPSRRMVANIYIITLQLNQTSTNIF